MEKQILDLLMEMNEGISSMNEKLSSMDERLIKVENAVNRIEVSQQEEVVTLLQIQGKKLGSEKSHVDKKFGDVERRLTELEERLNN